MIHVKNILGFLRHKGWELEETTTTHYLMKPPKEIKTSKDIRLHLVREKYSHTHDYQENVKAITKSIAKMYDLDYYMLEELFSKSLPQIKQYKEIVHGLLANVA